MRAGVVVTTARGRVPEPQRELQHVPGVLGLRPLADLVAPGGVELRPAQALGIARREDLRHRAVRPHQPPPARLPLGPPVGRRAGQDPGGAEDHDLPRLVERLADQGDPGTRPRVARLAPFDLRADPLGARAGLACPPAAQDDPGRPVSLGRQLVSQRPSARRARAGTSGHSDSTLSRKPSELTAAAAQTASLATISARAASRSSSLPAPPSVALVRFPRPASMSRTVCNALRCSAATSAAAFPSSPCPAFKSVIRSLRATVRSRYNASVRSSRSLSAARLLKLSCVMMPWLLRPGQNRNGRPEACQLTSSSLRVSLSEESALSIANSQVDRAIA